MAALVAAVFKSIRDNPQVTAERLAAVFQVPLSRSAQSDVIGVVYLSDVLTVLQNARLIVKKGQGGAATYTAWEGWAAIQRTLGISLSDLALRETGSALFVRPIFGAPQPRKVKGASGFVVMPFSKPMDRVHAAIRSALTECDIVPTRGDDIDATTGEAGHGGVMAEIWAAMNAAKLVVADCTGRRPNVMYELGIAHTLGKPVLLLAQAKKDIPFDVGHLRFIIYSSDDAGLAGLKSKIIQRLQGAKVPQASIPDV
jgi:hypothetical protein